MAKQFKSNDKGESEFLNWFQISNLLKLTYYNREIVRLKYGNDSHTEEEWRDILKKDGISF